MLKSAWKLKFMHKALSDYILPYTARTGKTFFAWTELGNIWDQNRSQFTFHFLASATIRNIHFFSISLLHSKEHKLECYSSVLEDKLVAVGAWIERQGSQDLSFSLPGVVNRSTSQFTHLQTGIYSITPSNHSQNINILTTTPSPCCSATALQLHLTFQ